MTQTRPTAPLHRRALSFALEALQLLAAGALISDENAKINNAAKGGQLNYRTDLLDDGTNPTGWYDNY